MFQKIRYFSVAAIKMYQDSFGPRQMTAVRETKGGFRNVVLGDGEPALIEIIPSQE